MDEEKKISNIENNILNEEAVLKKEEQKVQEISEEISEGKKNFPENSSPTGKSVTWLKDPYNLALVGIIAFALAIRIYYFFLTKDQALWWDEACYTSLAKNFILHTWDGTSGIISEATIRPILFTLFLSILMRIGLAEVGIRFVLILISTLSVFFLFQAVRELYNSKVALVSSLIYAVLWIQLFYTDRIMVHILAQALLFPSIYFFVKSLGKDKFNFKYFALSLFILSIATMIRYTKGLIFFAFIVVFVLYLWNNKFKLLANYRIWLSAFIGFLPLLIFFAINFMNTGNIFPALFGSYFHPGTTTGGESMPFFWTFLSYIPIYLQTVLFVFFILGLGKALFEVILGYDLVAKDKKLQSNILLILILLITCIFFIFYLRIAEDRYMFPASISIVTFAALGLVFVYDLIKKYSSYLAVIFIILILAFGAYQELKFADNIIKAKEPSYMQQKQGFEWLKVNVPENATIIGSGIFPYAVYYAERKYIEAPENLTDFLILEKKADYLVMHGFAPGPDYLTSYIQNQTEWSPLKVFYIDSQNKQPILIIYKREAQI